MLKVENDTEVGYINMFVDYIDSTPVTSKYIAACHTKEYDIVADMKSKRNWQPVTLPSKQEELIDYVYQLLKLISEDMKLLRAWAFEYSTSNKMVDKYQAFMRKTVEPFVHALRSYIELQLIDSTDTPVEGAQKKIFLSYCQRDHCIADIVDKSLTESVKDLATISRDVRDVRYRESFRRFMESIGIHDYVVMIISDNYLKSRNCLYEMLEVMRDRNYNRKLLFIVLSNADSTYYDEPPLMPIGAQVYTNEGQTEYTSYWQQQHDNLERQIARINNPVLSIEEAKELRIITKIQLDLPEFIAFLREHNGVSFSKLLESNFQEIVNVIKN
jgi:hypothetical protein